VPVQGGDFGVLILSQELDFLTKISCCIKTRVSWFEVYSFAAFFFIASNAWLSFRGFAYVEYV